MMMILTIQSMTDAQAVGGTQDLSLIIDFLGAYLFPNGEKVIEEFMVTGISLGGETSYRTTDL